MSVLFLLVPLAILLVAVFVGAYVWSTRTGQYDDMTTPAMRVVHDDVTELAAPDTQQRVPERE